jgi:hypothetical protein
MVVAVLSVAPSAAAVLLVICFCQPRHYTIINAFVAGCRPLSPTIASCCPLALLVPAAKSPLLLPPVNQWLVVAFSAHPSAYQLQHQAVIKASSFHTLGLILTYLE